jgi:hypothetical protein
VKNFLRRAYYRRFDLTPDPEFVETHPGGGAVGVRLTRYASLPELIRRLEAASPTPKAPRASAGSDAKMRFGG